MNGVPPKGANDATVAQQDATNQPRRNGQENSSNVIVGIMGATLIRSAARAADHETVLANSNDEDEDDANVANNNVSYLMHMGTYYSSAAKGGSVSKLLAACIYSH
jgi:hypothetical protein